MTDDQSKNLANNPIDNAAGQQTGEQPRKDLRRPVNLKITFKSATVEDFVQRYAIDISDGGIFVRTKKPLAVGTKVRFRFQLQGDSPLFSGSGVVAWTREYDPQKPTGAPGMGVKFVEMSQDSRDILADIVARKSEVSEVRKRKASSAIPPQIPAPRSGGQAMERPPSMPLASPITQEEMEEFATHPTRIAPGDLLEGLRKESHQRVNPFLTPEDVPEEAFQEETKVTAIDDIVRAAQSMRVEPQTAAKRIGQGLPPHLARHLPGATNTASPVQPVTDNTSADSTNKHLPAMSKVANAQSGKRASNRNSDSVFESWTSKEQQAQDEFSDIGSFAKEVSNEMENEGKENTAEPNNAKTQSNFGDAQSNLTQDNEAFLADETIAMEQNRLNKLDEIYAKAATDRPNLLDTSDAPDAPILLDNPIEPRHDTDEPITSFDNEVDDEVTAFEDIVTIDHSHTLQTWADPAQQPGTAQPVAVSGDPANAEDSDNITLDDIFGEESNLDDDLLDISQIIAEGPKEDSAVAGSQAVDTKLVPDLGDASLGDAIDIDVDTEFGVAPSVDLGIDFDTENDDNVDLELAANEEEHTEQSEIPQKPPRSTRSLQTISSTSSADLPIDDISSLEEVGTIDIMAQSDRPQDATFQSLTPQDVQATGVTSKGSTSKHGWLRYGLITIVLATCGLGGYWLWQNRADFMRPNNTNNNANNIIAPESTLDSRQPATKQQPSNAKTNLSTATKPVAVRLTAEPSDALIVIEGIAEATAPVTLYLQPGVSYRATISKDGYSSEDIEFTANGTPPGKITLVKQAITLFIESTPPGATAIVNGKTLATKTPVSIELATAAPVTVILRKEGFAATTKNVEPMDNATIKNGVRSKKVVIRLPLKKRLTRPVPNRPVSKPATTKPIKPTAPTKPQEPKPTQQPVKQTPPAPKPVDANSIPDIFTS